MIGLDHSTLPLPTVFEHYVALRKDDEQVFYNSHGSYYTATFPWNTTRSEANHRGQDMDLCVSELHSPTLLLLLLHF